MLNVIIRIVFDFGIFVIVKKFLGNLEGFSIRFCGRFWGIIFEKLFRMDEVEKSGKFWFEIGWKLF